jgi:hypothetical protein
MWTGRLPYGKCDIVPGELFVATVFQHIAWLPVIPLGSEVIVDGSIESYDDYIQSFKLRWQSVPIAFSFKSFLLAWFRTGLLVVIILAAIYDGYLLILWLNRFQPIAQTCFSIAIIGVAFALHRLSFAIAYADPQWAKHLRELIARKYGQP